MGCTKMSILWLLGVIVLLGEDGFLISVRADTMVTGTVFCDQCKDGQFSFFDYPLFGAKVAVTCTGANGQVMVYKEDNTNWFGSFSMRFEGTPDLSDCHAQVVRGPSGCGAAKGPARGLTMMFRMFGMAMYSVEAPLLSQPQEPMDFCPHSEPPASPTPLPFLPLPPPPPPSMSTGNPFLPPPLRPHPSPLFEASACPFEKWLMPEYRCHWRVVSPETRVALIFGPIAAVRYGEDMTLWEGLQGRGDIYRTLLREATASLLNSYNNLHFFYPTISVISHMNKALLGSHEEALMTALRFKRANIGVSGAATCNFSQCS